MFVRERTDRAAVHSVIGEEPEDQFLEQGVLFRTNEHGIVHAVERPDGLSGTGQALAVETVGPAASTSEPTETRCPTIRFGEPGRLEIRFVAPGTTTATTVQDVQLTVYDREPGRHKGVGVRTLNASGGFQDACENVFFDCPYEEALAENVSRLRFAGPGIAAIQLVDIDEEGRSDGFYIDDLSVRSTVGEGRAWRANGVLPSNRSAADEPEAWAWFGKTMERAGDRLVVGTPLDNEQGTDAGAVHILERDGIGWRQETKLAPLGLGNRDHFGAAFDLDQDTLAVGRPGANISCDGSYDCDSGGVHIYERFRGEWVLRDSITQPDPATGDRFGTSVALEDDLLVIGAPGRDEGGPSTGVAYVYERFASQWTRSMRLDTPAVSPYDAFGTTVAINDDRIYVGSPKEDIACPGELHCDSGAVLVFERSGDAWVFDHFLLPDEPVRCAAFGSTIRFIQDALLVGAPHGMGGCPTDAPSTGTVHLFHRPSGAWVQETVLHPPDHNPYGSFGAAVDYDGERIIVGRPLDDRVCVHDPRCDYGSADLFWRTGTSWEHVTTLTATEPREDTMFATDVLLDQEEVLVGVPGAGSSDEDIHEGRVIRLSPDSDRDGISDRLEVEIGTDALDPDSDDPDLLEAPHVLWGTSGFGSRPTADRADVDSVLEGTALDSAFPFDEAAPGRSIGYIDLDGSGLLDPEEPVYLAKDPGGKVSPRDVRLVNETWGPLGSQVESHHLDVGLDLTADFNAGEPGTGEPAIRMIDEDEDTRFTGGDTLVLDTNTVGHRNTSADPSVLEELAPPVLSGGASEDSAPMRPALELGDVYLSASEAGTIVAADDNAIGTNLTAVGTRLGFLDRDGSAGYTLADPLYVDTDADALATMQDVAWHEDNFGATLSPTGGEAVLILTPGSDDHRFPFDTAHPGRSMAYIDGDGDGILDHEEALYLATEPRENVTINDTRLANPVTGTEGSVVDSRDADVGRNITADFNGDAPGLGTPELRLVHPFGSATLAPETIIVLEVNDTRDTVDDGDVILSGALAGTILERAKEGRLEPEVLRNLLGAPSVPVGGELAYLDVDRNGTFWSGDQLYLDLDTDGFATVGDIRWHPNGFGQTIGPAQERQVSLLEAPGEGNSLFDPASPSPPVGYADQDEDQARDPAEPLYLSVDPTGTVQAGDLRLAGAHARPLGSLVAPQDLERGTPLSANFEVDPELGFVDEDGDGRFASSEPLVLDIASPAGIAGAGDVLVSGPRAGTTLLAGDALAGRTLSPFTAQLHFFDDDGDGALDRTDPLYLDTDANGLLTPRDVRWSAHGFGASLGSEHPAVGHTISSVRTEDGFPFDDGTPGLSIAYVDEDEDHFLDPGEVIYFSREADGVPPEQPVEEPQDTLVGPPEPEEPAKVVPGDVRLTPWNDAPAGSPVQAHDPDVGLNLTEDLNGPANGTGNATLAFVDVGGDRAFTGPDVLVLNVNETTPNVALGDLLLSGPDAGTLIDAAHPVLDSPLSPRPGLLGFVDEDGADTYGPEDTLVLDTDIDGLVTVQDVWLSKQGFGHAIQAGDPEATPVLEDAGFAGAKGAAGPPVAASFGYNDTDHDRVLDPGETVYLAANPTGGVRPGDLRVGGSDPVRLGTAVSPGDDDVGGSLTVDFNGPLRGDGDPDLEFLDRDLDLRFTPGDMLVLNVDADTPAVARGDLILSGSRAGTIVTAGASLVGDGLLEEQAHVSFFDSDGDRTYEPGEPLVLAFSGDGFATSGDVSLSAPSFGFVYDQAHRDQLARVDEATDDGLPFDLEEPARSVGFVDVDGDREIGPAEPVYLAAEPWDTVQPGDVRIGQPGAGVLGELVRPGAPDVGTNLSWLSEGAEIKLVDRDGAQVQTVGDGLVLSPSGGASLQAGDLWLSGPLAGSLVETSSRRVGTSLVSLDARLDLVDVDGNERYTLDDALVLVPGDLDDRDLAELENQTDPLDRDLDEDGLFNLDELLHGADPTLADTDGDGLEDGPEVHEHGTSPIHNDTDGDGLDDRSELVEIDWDQDGSPDPPSDPFDADTDNDGLRDGPEARLNTNLTNPDTDGDTLTDGDEVHQHGSDPTLVDTDGDSLSDPTEVREHGTDPADADTDGDGLEDGTEVNQLGSDPNDPNDPAPLGLGQEPSQQPGPHLSHVWAGGLGR